jgi:hypothetical protein
VAIAGPLRVELLESGIDASGFDILAQFTLQAVILGAPLQQFLVNIGACSSSTGWPCLACLVRHPVCSCTRSGTATCSTRFAAIAVLLPPPLTHGAVDPASAMLPNVFHLFS